MTVGIMLCLRPLRAFLRLLGPGLPVSESEVSYVVPRRLLPSRRVQVIYSILLDSRDQTKPPFQRLTSPRRNPLECSPRSVASVILCFLVRQKIPCRPLPQNAPTPGTGFPVFGNTAMPQIRHPPRTHHVPILFSRFQDSLCIGLEVRSDYVGRRNRTDVAFGMNQTDTSITLSVSGFGLQVMFSLAKRRVFSTGAFEVGGYTVGSLCDS